MTTGKPEYIRMSRTQAWVTIALGLVIAFTTLASLSLVNVAKAHPPAEGPSVRISALKGDGGTVTVAIQVMGPDGTWGERLLPAKSLLTTTSPYDTWLRSDAVSIDRGRDLSPLFCVVAHGAPDDSFWLKFRAFLYQSANLTDSDIRFETHLSGADQAAAIERCIADNAAMIASTMASPADVSGPLIRAKAEGARIVTFNAGLEHAESVGSQANIGLNDRAAGELAAREFNQRGISGQIVCLIHERDNLSLEDRCDGLEAVYGGAGVTRIRLEEAANDLEHGSTSRIDRIASLLGGTEGPPYDAVLALNADTLRQTLAAVSRLDGAAEGLRITAVGATFDDLVGFPEALLEQHVDVLISDSVETQGFFVASAMELIYNVHNGRFASQPQLWLAQPSLIRYQTARENTDEFESISASLERLIEQSRTTERQAVQGDVRVAAFQRLDGSIVFAIESLGADGRWIRQDLGPRRVLHVDAPTGRWLSTSAVKLSSPSEHAPLFCVVTHGSKQDYYWKVWRAYMHLAGHLADSNFRYESHLDGADQAAAIDQCSADGAAVIASTLADPEAVTDSLLAAKRAGARIVTFNSGDRHAAAAGSEIHVALDDREVGPIATRRIAEEGITGPIACIIHEDGNDGLEERCDSLEQSYTGASVIRLRLTEGATNAQIVDELITALTDPRHVDIELAMVLNADTMLNALDAFDQIFTASGRSIRILSIGATVDLARVSLDIRNRHLRALFNDSVESQGYLVMSAMQFVHNYHTPAELVGSPQLWMASPYLLDSAKARAAVTAEELRWLITTQRRYVAEAAADDE
ncbi:MAG: substrate-binding domain-containing protein [Chloroflexi bacterium]|nr:substrate-binding domain-containing protein [Chloroflexota bacterium]